MKMLKIMLTDREEEHLRNGFLVEYFCCLGQFSSVVELFIGFLTSGLGFVKSCWGRILWCSGGLLLLYFYLSGDLGYF